MSEHPQPTQGRPAVRWTPAGLTDGKGAAAYLGLAPKTLSEWRFLGKGPSFVKQGGRVFYRRSDLDAWLEAGTATSTAQARFKRQTKPPVLKIAHGSAS